MPEIIAGLTAEQRRAVEAVSGPVVVIAGAGSGKTTTITRRIANQVKRRGLRPESILAVTFTTKAADELRHRLEALDISGVQTRTFHSTALRQVERLGNVQVDVLEAKSRILTEIRRSLPRGFQQTAVADLATEIERAKAQRLTPDTYPERRARTAPPIPEDLMCSVFAQYEEEKARRRQLDFEDLLEHAIRIFETDPHAVAQFRAACSAITVDEYQDVNLLQQALLDLWLGDSEEICVVGDDYQAIFAFAGASPEYLIGMRGRFSHGTIATLETNFRSTPEILAVANRLAPHLGGLRKTLVAHAESGPEPTLTVYDTPAAEVDAVVRQIRKLVAEGTPPGEIAVLYRINARSVAYEMALAAADIPVQVAQGGFLERQAARSMLARLRRGGASTEVADTITGLADQAGLLDQPDQSSLGRQEYTRQLDLHLLVELALEYDDGTHTVGHFIEHLRERFGSYQETPTRDAVRLSSIHSAKGLEWDAVFLPGLGDGELPISYAIADKTIPEERRLFYVALTRARQHLRLSHSKLQSPSRFLDEIQPTAEDVAA